MDRERGGWATTGVLDARLEYARISEERCIHPDRFRAIDLEVGHFVALGTCSH
jgi:hypothetical protein